MGVTNPVWITGLNAGMARLTAARATPLPRRRRGCGRAGVARGTAPGDLRGRRGEVKTAKAESGRERYEGKNMFFIRNMIHTFSHHAAII